MRQSDKFYVDMKKLQYNILCIKYKKTNAYKSRPADISDEAKDVVMDILNNKFNKKIYDKLNDSDKVTIETFLKNMKWTDLGIENESTIKLYKEFNILRGSLQAGNNNPEIKASLNEKLIQLIELKKISYINGLRILYEISIM